jgi:hypothetical protein
MYVKRLTDTMDTSAHLSDEKKSPRDGSHVAAAVTNTLDGRAAPPGRPPGCDWFGVTPLPCALSSDASSGGRSACARHLACM